MQNRTTFARHTRLLSAVLVFALFATLIHVSLHDLDESGSGPTGHQDCQLSQQSNGLLPSLLPLFSPLLSVFLLVVISNHLVFSEFPRTQHARAPPF